MAQLIKHRSQWLFQSNIFQTTHLLVGGGHTPLSLSYPLCISVPAAPQALKCYRYHGCIRLWGGQARAEDMALALNKWINMEWRRSGSGRLTGASNAFFSFLACGNVTGLEGFTLGESNNWSGTSLRGWRNEVNGWLVSRWWGMWRMHLYLIKTKRSLEVVKIMDLQIVLCNQMHFLVHLKQHTLWSCGCIGRLRQSGYMVANKLISYYYYYFMNESYRILCVIFKGNVIIFSRRWMAGKGNSNNQRATLLDSLYKQIREDMVEAPARQCCSCAWLSVEWRKSIVNTYILKRYLNFSEGWCRADVYTSMNP